MGQSEYPLLRYLQIKGLAVGRCKRYRCVHGRIHGDPMCTGKSLSTQDLPRFIEIIKQLASKHEVFRRSWRESRRESRTGSRVQTVFKIQKRSNWNSHLRCLWHYCLLFIKKCRCVLDISTRVRPKHPCKRIWRIHGVAVRPVRAYGCRRICTQGGSCIHPFWDYVFVHRRM